VDARHTDVVEARDAVAHDLGADGRLLRNAVVGGAAARHDDVPDLRALGAAIDQNDLRVLEVARVRGDLRHCLVVAG